ncbi:MAG: DUF456 domain-containing protein [Candidatus Rokubacteria bacterium]|nr:DUF456 domain-containing protein [Candidatus Rokubacteria bacterium]
MAPETLVAVHVLVGLMMLLGLAGAVIPVLPGPPLILLGALLYALATGWTPVGVGRLVILATLTVVASVAGHLGTVMGAKRAGGSRWAVIGALAGGVVGIAFAPLGLIVGPLAGAIAGELFRTGELRESIRTGVGAAVGVLAGAVLQFALALVMVALFVWWIWRA